MIKLKEDVVMTNKDLAEWFGISYDYFVHHKKEKLEELRKYCNFIEVKRKVQILEVYHSIYKKNNKQGAYEIASNNLNDYWNKSNLDTVKDVSTRMYRDFNPTTIDGKNMKLSTFYYYTKKAKVELFGKPFEEGGTMGECVYEWATKGDDGRPRAFTPEEKITFKKYLKAYLGDADEKTLFVKEKVNNGELTSEEAWEYYSDLIDLDNKFKAMVQALWEEGIFLIRATRIYRYNKLEGNNEEITSCLVE